MADTVWVSLMMVKYTIAVRLNVGRDLWDRSVLRDVFERYQWGETLKPDEFPKAFYSDYHDIKLEKLPDVFNADGFFCFSVRGMTVFKDFDLGEGGFAPTQIFQYDRTTPVEGEYFCLNFGARKRACVVEKSQNLQRASGGPFPFWIRADSKDHDIAVSDAAFFGADLWTDHNLGEAVFMSDQLVKALAKYSMAEKLDLKRCLLVDENTNG